MMCRWPGGPQRWVKPPESCRNRPPGRHPPHTQARRRCSSSRAGWRQCCLAATGKLPSSWSRARGWSWKPLRRCRRASGCRSWPAPRCWSGTFSPRKRANPWNAQAGRCPPPWCRPPWATGNSFRVAAPIACPCLQAPPCGKRFGLGT